MDKVKMSMSKMAKQSNHNWLWFSLFCQSLQWTFSIVLLTEPEQPVDIVATGRGTSQLNVTWTLPGGSVDQYNVNISNAALSYTSSQTTQTTTASFTGLQSGRVYEVTVTAVAGHFSNRSATGQLATGKSWPMVAILCIYCRGSEGFVVVCSFWEFVWESVRRFSLCLSWKKANVLCVCLCEYEFGFATFLTSLISPLQYPTHLDPSTSQRGQPAPSLSNGQPRI